MTLAVSIADEVIPFLLKKNMMSFISFIISL